MRTDLSLAGPATSIIFVGEKSFVATNTCLPRQNTSFVATKVGLPRQNVCCDKIMSGQRFCRDKICLSRKEKQLVTTNILWSRQKTCFVAANTCLSRQTFFPTKMILVAASANDRSVRTLNTASHTITWTQENTLVGMGSAALPATVPNYPGKATRISREGQ